MLLQSSEGLLWDTASQRNLGMETHYCQERLTTPVLLSSPSAILARIARWLTFGKLASVPEPWVTHMQTERVMSHLFWLGA